MDNNLSNRSLDDLRKLQEQVTTAIRERQEQDLREAREKIAAIAASVGVPVHDLVDVRKPNKNKGQAAAIRYRNPNDASQEWTGRGRSPKWVKEWVESGKSIDELRVE